MAERIAYLEAVVGADITQFRKSMRDIRSDVGVLSDTIGGISGAARTMTFAFTAPMVALGTYAVQAASTFDASMRNINSIAHLPDAQFAALSQQVLDFGKNTRSGTQAAADALYEVYSAGITGKQAFDLMAVSTKMAEAGLSDLSQTTNALTATVMAFASQGLSAAHASDIWTAMVQQGVGSLSDFMANSQKVAPLANLLGISFENVGANAAFMSQMGGGAQKAMTSLAMAMSNIIKPNETMKESFASLGVTTGKELIDKFGSLEGAIMALKKAAGNDVDFAAMFSKTGLEYASTISNNIDAVTASVQKFHGMINGATESAWNEQMKSFAAVWDKLQTALITVATVIGQKIIPIITPMIEGFTRTLLAITEVNPEIITMAIAFTGVLAAAAPVVWLLTSMLNPIGLVIGGVTALGTAFATNFMGARDTVQRVVTEIIGDVTPLFEIFNDFWKKVFPEPPTKESWIGTGAMHIQSDEFIVIDKPTSLWQLYKDKGYDAMFSWDEFMKMAKESGWDGKGLDIGDKIKLPDVGKMNAASGALNLVAGAMKNLYAHYANKDTMYDPVSGKVIEKQVNFFDRLAEAADAAWPKIQTALSTIWTNIKNWVDGTAIPELDRFGSKIFATVAGWFEPTSRNGKTEAYAAVKGVFDGGAAKGIDDGIKVLEGKFPAISAGLKGMVDSIGAWLKTEGVPTISRSIGYFVGTLGATIGQVMGALGSNIMGGGAGKAAEGLGKGISDTILTPAMAGFNDAMKDKGVTNSTDGFFSGLAGLLVAGAGVATFGKMLTGQGFVAAVFSTIGAVLQGAKAVINVGFGILQSIANSLMNTSMGAALANGATNFASRVMASITDKIDYQIKLPVMMKWDSLTTSIGNSLSGAFKATTTWASGVGTAIWGAIAPAIGVAAAAAGLVLGTILIAGSVGVLFSPSFREKVVVAFRDVISSVVDQVFGDGTWAEAQQKAELGGYKVAAAFFRATGDKAKADTIEKMFTPDPTRIGLITQASLEEAAKNPFYFTPELIAANPEIDFTATPSVTMDKLILKWDKLVESGQMSSDNEGEMIRYLQQIMTNPDLKTNFGKGYDLYLDMLNLKPTNVRLDTKEETANRKDNDLLGMLGMDSESIKKSGEVMNTELNTTLSTFGATVLANLGEGGSLDANRIITQFLNPLEEHWNTMFMAGGVMYTNFQTFINTFSTGIAAASLGIGLFAVAAMVSNTLVSNSFLVYDSIKTKIQQVNTEVKLLTDTLNSLIMHSPYEVVINVTTNGSVPATPAGSKGNDTGGKTHATGLYNVPYDNYVASLHESEMVLDKQEARDYRNLPAVMGSLIRSAHDNGGNSGGSVNNQINVYGVQDTDALLRELDRRGIKLENR